MTKNFSLISLIIIFLIFLFIESSELKRIYYSEDIIHADFYRMGTNIC